MSDMEVWATMRFTVDVDAVREDDPESYGEMSDEQVAAEYIEGTIGAPIDNYITIRAIFIIEAPK